MDTNQIIINSINQDARSLTLLCAGLAFEHNMGNTASAMEKIASAKKMIGLIEHSLETLEQHI